ncbi:hypothetical protein GPECTOR_3g231 [Gonium pectorale]|uniref:Ubiquitin thioesterase OTU n=1 Tax=Gonium pectorale TaxID=33097 RepID=A0A150GZ45_GONPE|nr:hypothetical protein GPECTOR_3g231 [Gonium pectorale]|eukprot:KXZ55075.1 hypothetical protein GPECTOR_3g231 [Gonium pectorale]
MLAVRRSGLAPGRTCASRRQQLGWTLGAAVRPEVPPPAIVSPAPASAASASARRDAPSGAAGSPAPPLTRTAAAGPAGPQATSLPTAFRVHRISGDGACMFRAVVQGAQYATRGKPMPPESEGAAAHNLRLAVVAELRKRRDEIEPFLPGIAADFDEYCRTMSHPMAWGGEPEMVMAVHVVGRPITVFHVPEQGGALEPIVTYGEGLLESGLAPICLLWSGAHYDLLLPAAGQA